jgi:hypothetical protein
VHHVFNLLERLALAPSLSLPGAISSSSHAPSPIGSYATIFGILVPAKRDTDNEQDTISLKIPTAITNPVAVLIATGLPKHVILTLDVPAAERSNPKEPGEETTAEGRV